MAKVTVPRTQITELLGLPPDVDDETLNRELEKAIARVGATAVSAAEQRDRAEDRRIVLAAVNDGRIPASRVGFWLDACARDRTGNREIIAVLAPGLPPKEPIADPDVAYASEGVKSALGRLGFTPAPRTVEAAGLRANPLPSPTAAFDSIGGALSQIPAPVRMVRGKDPATWTDAEKNNAVARQMFPGIRHLLPPDPGSAGYYLPTGSEPRLPVQLESGDIEWRSNPNYRAGD
jgi:hypothetical protein